MPDTLLEQKARRHFVQVRTGQCHEEGGGGVQKPRGGFSGENRCKQIALTLKISKEKRFKKRFWREKQWMVVVVLQCLSSWLVVSSSS